MKTLRAKTRAKKDPKPKPTEIKRRRPTKSCRETARKQHSLKEKEFTRLRGRLGRTTEARAFYERALGLTKQEPEQRFLERRLRELPE